MGGGGVGGVWSGIHREGGELRKMGRKHGAKS